MLQVFDTAEQELAASGQPSSSRGCKYALNTLMQTFQLKTMAASVAAGPVRHCIDDDDCCHNPCQSSTACQSSVACQPFIGYTETS